MYSALIPIFLGIFILKNREKYLIFIFILAVVSFLSDVMSLNHPNYRNIVLPVYRYTQLFLILSAYNFLFKNVYQRTIIFLLGGLLIYAVLYYAYLENLARTFPSIRTLSSFVFLLTSLFYFYYLHKNLLAKNLLLFPPFWLNVGVLIYFAGNIFLNVAINIFTMHKVYVIYMIVHSSLNILKNLLFATSFFIAIKYSKRITYNGI